MPFANSTLVAIIINLITPLIQSLVLAAEAASPVGGGANKLKAVMDALRPIFRLFGLDLDQPQLAEQIIAKIEQLVALFVRK